MNHYGLASLSSSPGLNTSRLNKVNLGTVELGIGYSYRVRFIGLPVRLAVHDALSQ